MSDSTFFVSKSAVRALKQSAQRHVRGVSSSHLSEGVAAALGFKTHAALRAALEGRATAEAQKPSNARLVQRLRQLGYASVPDDLRLLPEFEHSYSPFQNFPLRKGRSVRWRAWRNLLVAAINAGLEQRLFGLSPGENWWPGGVPESHECERSTYRFMVDGEIAAIASVNAISGDELSISVILNPRKADIQPEWYCGLADGDAVAHCWLERRLGAWIQDGGENFRCKRVMQSRLADLTIEPNGYSDQGSFFM
ncbi:hypothetical protein HMEPL2_31660 [Vreelandella aquamarina]|uniref:Uncharacterized protein n=1 Tax=Vreelandella aquamarina TaxID=77097 RepID=A0A6F8XGD8_9GAMM|nr:MULTISPECIES: hypothetical protein [Oceanospirillales]MAP34421.1 hypothetical protein [Halomonas sp.]MBI46629.1 hypothetical protein [Marinobacter sp.]MBS97594.1 hypothetical protein [Oceanospirillaceae bacterium]MCE7524000.1 hypothetical protein [Alloalcanivorax xenomutans]BCB72815.1 hypothetical protein HMEPL2_31660 [Halomonas meridiana]